MTELERIKELTPKFQLTVLSSINRIETMIAEMISVDFCKEADDIYKRVSFFNYFEDNLRLQNKIDLLQTILIYYKQYCKLTTQIFFTNFLTTLMNLMR